VPMKAKPSPRTPSKVAGVVDAIDVLERRRRASSGAGRGKPTGRRGDLDLDGIR
jgi:hypothetical protein